MTWPATCNPHQTAPVIAFDTMSFGVQDSILVVGVAQLGASDFILS
jgi:hypothetical protein